MLNSELLHGYDRIYRFEVMAEGVLESLVRVSLELTSCHFKVMRCQFI